MSRLRTSLVQIEMQSGRSNTMSYSAWNAQLRLSSLLFKSASPGCIVILNGSSCKLKNKLLCWKLYVKFMLPETHEYHEATPRSNELLYISWIQRRYDSITWYWSGPSLSIQTYIVNQQSVWVQVFIFIFWEMKVHWRTSQLINRTQ